MPTVAAATWHAEVPETVMAAIAGLSPRLRASLLADPETNDSQRELYSNAAILSRAGVDDENRLKFLRAKWSGYYREITDREFERAIEHTRLDALASRTAPSWPDLDPKFRESVLQSTPGDLASLREESPVKNPGALSTGAIIDALFPGNPWLCFDFDRKHSSTERRRSFAGHEADYQFLVPNTMSAEQGETGDGRLSQRTNNNVGAQKYQVIEFDNGTLDEQAKLHGYLRSFGVPLVMVVWSGSKSLHGWYNVSALAPVQLNRFLHWAALLGCDRGMFTRCQLCRMPNAERDNGHKQEVMYLNLEATK